MVRKHGHFRVVGLHQNAGSICNAAGQEDGKKGKREYVFLIYVVA